MVSAVVTPNPKNPRVSILLPFHDYAPYLEEALESVICQSYSNFECLLISNNAHESALKVARSYCRKDKRFRILEADGLSFPQALNLAIVKCNGDYLARMDSDDIMGSDRILRQLLEFDEDPELILCGGFIERFGEVKDSIEYPTSDLEIKVTLVFRSCFAHPTIMAKKYLNQSDEKCLINYNEKFAVCEDYDLFVRYFSSGLYKNVPDILLRYRVHDKQTTFTQSRLINRLSNQTRTNYIRSLGGSFRIAILHNAKVNGVPFFPRIEKYLVNQIASLLYSSFDEKYLKSQIAILVRRNYEEAVKPPSIGNLFSCIRVSARV